MFSWLFGRRRPSISSNGEARTMHTPLLKPKGCMSRNPFFFDLVIEMMLEESDVDTLKTLREMNSNWNKLDLMELEKRSVEGQLGQLDFSNERQKKMNQFSKSTKAIPQLFHSFKFHFPISFKSIHHLMEKCTPIFLHLEFNENIEWTEKATTNLRNFFSWISPTLEELEVESTEDDSIQKKVTIFNIPSANGAPIVFHKLTKIFWNMGKEYWNVHPDFRNEHPFQFILDKSGAVDPTPNLTILEADINEEFLEMMHKSPTPPRWTQLTILRIQDNCQDYVKFPVTLLALAQAGMCLKVFALDMVSPVAASPGYWANWSQFFATQAKSLQVWELEWFCEDDVYDIKEFMLPKIRLPIFESLHTLHFYLSGNVRQYPSREPVDHRVFEMGSFPRHFPKVVNMRVNEQGLLNIYPVEGEPVHLKCLIINGDGVPNNWGVWTSRIQSVESLKFKGSLLSDGEAEVPWKESIKEFQSKPEPKELEFPYNHCVSYDTKLFRRIIIIR